MVQMYFHRRLIIAILTVALGLIMVDVSSSGKDRIQSNDGTMKIGITDRQMRITQPGVAAVDATDQDTIINENNNSFKIVASGTIPSPATEIIPNPGIGNYVKNQGVATVTHNLGYIPVAFVFQQTGTRNIPLPYTSHFGSGTQAYWLTHQVSVGDTDISYIIEITVTGLEFPALPPGEAVLKYYLLQETAAPN